MAPLPADYRPADARPADGRPGGRRPGLVKRLVIGTAVVLLVVWIVLLVRLLALWLLMPGTGF